MKAIILTSERLELRIRPDLGGRIEDFIDRATGKQWLWHPDGYRGGPRSLPVGASYDDHWSGGWDDLFPSDAACHFHGRDLPDHGEIWSQAWTAVELEPSSVRLAYECKSVPARIEKLVSVAGNVATLTYTITNLSDAPLPHLFKLHPAMAIEAGDRLLMPRCKVEAVDIGFSGLIGVGGKTDYPSALDKNHHAISIDVVPPRAARTQEFIYLTELAEGWCGLRNERTGTAFLLRFSLDHLPYVWQFQTYGGWRDHYVAVLEPCTNVPKDLVAAEKRGACAVLAPHERRVIQVSAEIVTERVAR